MKNEKIKKMEQIISELFKGDHVRLVSQVDCYIDSILEYLNIDEANVLDLNTETYEMSDHLEGGIITFRFSTNDEPDVEYFIRFTGVYDTYDQTDVDDESVDIHIEEIPTAGKKFERARNVEALRESHGIKQKMDVKEKIKIRDKMVEVIRTEVVKHKYDMLDDIGEFYMYSILNEYWDIQSVKQLPTEVKDSSDHMEWSTRVFEIQYNSESIFISIYGVSQLFDFSEPDDFLCILGKPDYHFFDIKGMKDILTKMHSIAHKFENEKEMSEKARGEKIVEYERLGQKFVKLSVEQLDKEFIDKFYRK